MADSKSVVSVLGLWIATEYVSLKAHDPRLHNECSCGC